MGVDEGDETVHEEHDAVVRYMVSHGKPQETDGSAKEGPGANPEEELGFLKQTLGTPRRKPKGKTPSGKV